MMIAFKTVVSILFCFAVKLQLTYCQYKTYDTYGAGPRNIMYGGAFQRPIGGYPSYSQTDTVNYQRTPGGGQMFVEDKMEQYPNGQRDVMITNIEREPAIGGGYGGAGAYNNAGYGGYGKRKRRNIVEEGSRDPTDKSSPASFYSG
jgi:hypothetical protein